MKLSYDELLCSKFVGLTHTMLTLKALYIRAKISVTRDITTPTRLKSHTEFSINGTIFQSNGCDYVACDTNLLKIALIS